MKYILHIIFIILEIVLLVATVIVMRAGVERISRSNMNLKSHIDTKTSEVKMILGDEKNNFNKLLKLMGYETK